MKAIVLAALVLVAAGCAGGRAPLAASAGEAGSWPPAFAGRTFEIVTASGVRSVVSLAPGGAMTIVPALSADVVTGTWVSRAEGLCTRFARRGEECWDPASVLAAHGEFVPVRSDRGQELKIRLLDGREEQALGASS